jgi:hypothetical protein
MVDPMPLYVAAAEDVRKVRSQKTRKKEERI